MARRFGAKLLAISLITRIRISRMISSLYNNDFISRVIRDHVYRRNKKVTRVENDLSKRMVRNIS